MQMNCHSCDGAGCAWCGGSGVEPNKLARLSQKAIDTWGIENQVDIAIGELAELIDALSKHKQGRNKIRDVAEEVAGVMVVTEQLKRMIDNCLLDDELEKQMNKLEKYIKEGGR